MQREFWQGKRVLVTGHTGFKGGWLSFWLANMGVNVFGYALAPPTEPNFFSICQLGDYLQADIRGDIRDRDKLKSMLQDTQPEIVFHLAAQPLVRDSYAFPFETYETNVMGTISLFEAIRQAKSVKAIVNVTTDKCYENKEWVWPYRENEAMGGYDPYSSSKACAELVTSAYRQSFFQDTDQRLASARAGNVIGGGDFAKDRLLPDFFRAIDAGETLIIRSPKATRPWQHVLEPLSGYLTLAERLFEIGDLFAQAWNFGPEEGDAQSVEWIVKKLCDLYPDAKWKLDENPVLHEANMLLLSSAKANKLLQWQARWRLAEALTRTVTWHMAWRAGEDMQKITQAQIHDYEAGLEHE